LKIYDIKYSIYITSQNIKNASIIFDKIIKIFAFFLIWEYNRIKDFLYLICKKMNKFRVNLHPAFFDGEKLNGSSETPKDKVDLELERQRQIVEQSRMQEEVLKGSIRRNNEALASSTVVETREEKDQSDKEVSKLLEKQLKQLAKNKKIDMPWTDNAWKCSRAEKRLATSSAKVFQQLLDAGTLTQMVNKCKSKN
jgi:hypothetical protein